jgi:tryptophan synthase alpha subunit
MKNLNSVIAFAIIASMTLAKVSHACVLGSTLFPQPENKEVKNDEYLNKLASINLKNPVMIGFGIKNKTDFEQVTEKSQGGIIGTAFVKILLENNDWKEKAEAFIKSIK